MRDGVMGFGGDGWVGYSTAGAYWWRRGRG